MRRPVAGRFVPHASSILSSQSLTTNVCPRACLFCFVLITIELASFRQMRLMKTRFHSGFIYLILALAAHCAAQEEGVSLGDLARSLRKEKAQPAVQQSVIDNDNFDAILAEVESRKFTGGMLFSFDPGGKSFEVSSPDVTCSLSFSAKATALLTNPYAPQDVPEEELAKIDGPATIDGDSLQLSVYNGTAWNLKEITVGLTLVRRPTPTAAYGSSPRLVPASAVESTTTEKRSDVTVLYSLKGSAAPSTTTVFRETIGMLPAPDQEWHWAIVKAKGTPPR